MYNAIAVYEATIPSKRQSSKQTLHLDKRRHASLFHRRQLRRRWIAFYGTRLLQCLFCPSAPTIHHNNNKGCYCLSTSLIHRTAYHRCILNTPSRHSLEHHFPLDSRSSFDDLNSIADAINSYGHGNWDLSLSLSHSFCHYHQALNCLGDI
uniref:Uncharacterized protein n=1 Tax=Parascaris equorum TaxID=6256 RepID=A0A914RBN2_PAREQ